MNKNTKIAFLTPFLSTGGAERVAINVSGNLFKRGFNVQIVAGTIVDNTLSKLPEGLKVFDLQNKNPLGSPSFYSNTKALLKYIREEKPDVIISTSDYLNMAVVLARFFSKRKFKIIAMQQVHISAYLHELPWLNRRFIQFIHKIVFKKADTVVGASEGVMKDLVDRYKLHNQPTGKFRKIYNPLYEDKITVMANEAISDGPFNIPGLKLVTVGRLVKQKDHATLLRAFKGVVEKIPEAHLFIIGIGPEEAALKNLALELGIGDKITFLGYKENPYAYVAKCDLFILSSIYEGFGNVVVEALATGTNVVSTDCPSGPAEILNNGEFGFLCPPKNPALLQEAIVKALQNKMSSIVLHNRATEFSIETITEKYLDAVFPN